MSQGQTAKGFEALVATAASPDFEPFVTFQKPPPLQALFEVAEPQNKAKPEALETYERHTAVSANPHNDFPARVSSNGMEVEALKKRIVELEQDIVQINAERELEKAEICKSLGTDLANRLLDSLQGVEERLGQDLAHMIGSILEPFVAGQIRKKILDAFLNSVKNSLTGGESAKVAIHGPAQYHATIQQAFEANLMQIEIVDSSADEITAELNGVVLSTRFQHWSDLLSGGER